MLGVLNDLWRYNVKNNSWTWESGSTIVDQKGIYGEQGNASIENVPGSRLGAVGWFDSLKQEFWLFGGLGYGITHTGMPGSGYLNDLWRYQVNDSTWTWMSGNDTINQPHTQNW